MKRGLFIAFVFLLIADITLGQCAMCKAVAESNGDDTTESVGAGLNSGIIYLMFIPYILLFFLFRKQIFGFIKRSR